MAKSIQNLQDPPRYFEEVVVRNNGSEEYVPLAWVMKILSGFKAIDCNSCHKHVGYHHRQDPNLIFCNDELCLQKNLEKFETLGKSKADVGQGMPNKSSSVKMMASAGISGDNLDSRSAQGVELFNDISSVENKVADPKYLSPRPERRKAVDLKGSSSLSSNDSSPETRIPKYLQHVSASLKSEKRQKRPVTNSDEIPSRPSPNGVMPEAKSSNPFKKSSSTRMNTDTAFKSISRDQDKTSREVDINGKTDSGRAPLPKPLALMPNLKCYQQSLPPFPTSLSSRKDKKIWMTYDIKRSPSLKNGARAVVSFVWAPDLFHINAIADLPKLNELQSEITEYSQNARDFVRRPEENDIVFAPYKGGEFYRAFIEVVHKGKLTVKVNFLDYGDTSVLDVTTCKEPCDEIMRKHPIYGVGFKCPTTVPIPKGFKLSPDLLEITEKEFIMQTEKQDQWTWCGKLHLDDVGSWNSLLNKGIIDYLQIEGMELDHDGKETLKPASVSTEVVEKESRLEPGTCINKKTAATKLFLQNTQVSPAIKHGATVRITFMWSYGKLTLSPVDNLPKIEQLQSVIQKYAKAAPPLSHAPKKDEIVLAPYDGYYGRAVVESMVNEEAFVRFLDIGDERIVRWQHLKQLNQEIQAHPLYSILFILEDIPEELPNTRIRQLEHCLESHCQMEVINKENGDVWSGYLWVASDRTWNDIVLENLEESS